MQQSSAHRYGLPSWMIPSQPRPRRRGKSQRSGSYTESPHDSFRRQETQAPTGINQSKLEVLSEQKAKKRITVKKSQSDRTPKISRKITSGEPNFRALEMKWLSEHRAQYAGQWVVIEGEQLIAHGLDGREVYLKAREAGIASPLLVRVEPEDQLPFGGW